MKILFLADPNSIHDIKWMTFFAEQHQCFLVYRKHHESEFLRKCKGQDFKTRYNIEVLGPIVDFSIRHYSRSLKQAKLLKKIIEDQQINLFHIMYAEPNALWANFKNKLKVPIILTTRGTDVLKTIPAFFKGKGGLNKVVSFFYKRAFNRIDYVVSTSTRQKKSVQNITKKLCPVDVIRTGVNVDEITQDTTKYRLSELQNQNYVFFPRAMRPLYQHELAVKAIAALPSNIKEKYSFVFIDKDSRNQDYVFVIQGLMSQVKANFIWLNKLNQQTLFQTYKDASLVVMTPISDGTPVTAIEAMLCKIPVILPPLEYDADIFDETVLFFDSWDASSLAGKMSAVLSGIEIPNLQKAYDRACLLADRNKEMQKLRKIYEQLCP